MSDMTDFEDIRRQLALTMHAHWKLFLAQGILMMVLGLLAVAEPVMASLAVGIFVGWLFFVGGIFRAASVWHSRHAPGFAWSMLTAVLSIVLGLILILRPLAAGMRPDQHVMSPGGPTASLQFGPHLTVMERRFG
jgi:uncharacterized membrane protein HdeD (DUF308 family)